MFSLKSRRDKWRILVVGAASFLTIFPLCVWRHLDIIEEDILDRANAALSEANLAGIDMLVNGRDVTISGSAAELEIARATRVVGSLRGVRKVERSAGRDGEVGRN